MYRAEVIADSMSPDGVRLTTLEVEYPHAIHKDIMTHRMFSRSFKSFRAFPPEKVIANIEDDPFIPETFDSRVTGMGQGQALPEEQELRARELWEEHIDHTLNVADQMIELEIAKAQVNFLLQDLTWITGIITATEWDNFYALRRAENARPEVQKIANLMYDAMYPADPDYLALGEPHLPYIRLEDRMDVGDNFQVLAKVSAGRCARVSYLNHRGHRDLNADVHLANQLESDGHMSPFEHVATPVALTGPKWIKHVYHTGQVFTLPGQEWRGNFYGWLQYRKTIRDEHNYELAA
ncbi:FAD-dependent thymidylate synthase [Candidatus Solirubrobacter pratensis]|uniref:FAD-dependent thymidylate synthase n=1 Tax=Candidatus Solirubrobacter pratensis TaxID=1298857 RepID=UPI0006856CEB|nr:FAD-dependent thymidylate synthase [Candidatus Solirubrobacter pratensis]